MSSIPYIDGFPALIAVAPPPSLLDSLNDWPPTGEIPAGSLGTLQAQARPACRAPHEAEPPHGEFWQCRLEGAVVTLAAVLLLAGLRALALGVAG